MRRGNAPYSGRNRLLVRLRLRSLCVASLSVRAQRRMQSAGRFHSRRRRSNAGWFYSLHAIASAVFGSNAYNNVISLGHIVDEQGRKMSKSKGNTVDPWQILNSEGADSLRWYLFSAGNPGTC